jgi:hypothetical protein
MSKGNLYRGRGTKEAQLRRFRAAYGRRGPGVYGAVVGKVAREQARKRGKKVEKVKGHMSTSVLGKPYFVKAHEAVLVGERYKPGSTYTVITRPYEVPTHVSHSKTGKREIVRRHKVKAHKTRVRRL